MSAENLCVRLRVYEEQATHGTSYHFHFKVKKFARSKHRWRIRVGPLLAVGPLKWRARDHHRGRTAMVPHGQMQPVGQESVIRITEHGADVGGVTDGRVKVGVVADFRRKVHRDVAHGMEG